MLTGRRLSSLRCIRVQLFTELVDFVQCSIYFTHVKLQCLNYTVASGGALLFGGRVGLLLSSIMVICIKTHNSNDYLNICFDYKKSWQAA